MGKIQSQIIIITAALLAVSCSRQTMSVEELRVEHMENPSVVDATHPRLSWINVPKSQKARGIKQTAYRIVVASSMENLKQGIYDLWDSGKQLSEESDLIPYQGKTLPSAQDCYWKVQTWDQDGKPTAWSKPSYWGMGLMNEDEWQAQWIAPLLGGPGAPLLRKHFDSKGQIKQAKVFVCGLGYFELYVNGERIGDDYLVPNMTDYTKRFDLEKGPIAISGNMSRHRVMYLAYDITKQIQEGRIQKCNHID